MDDLDRNRLIAHIRSSPIYGSLVRLMQEALKDERSQYESTDPTEYRRGRVKATRDMCELLLDNRRAL